LASAPSLLDPAEQRTRAYASQPALRHLRIVGSALGDDAGIIGAALLAR
jgi:hypothetical protein